jgi:hypothetical protein
MKQLTSCRAKGSLVNRLPEESARVAAYSLQDQEQDWSESLKKVSVWHYNSLAAKLRAGLISKLQAKLRTITTHRLKK